MNDEAYRFALQSVVRRERRDLGVLQLSGADAVDFVQRISTNDVRGVSDEEYATTIFCNEKGRIVDVVMALRQGHELLLVHSASKRDELVRHLRTYIVMDDVSLHDLSSRFRLVELTGPSAAELCSALVDRSVSPLPRNRVHALGEVNDLRIIPLYEGREESYLVIIDGAADDSSFEEVFRTTDSCMELDESAAEVLRIEQGRGAIGKELTTEHNPLEANLLHLVNFKKGCYIGQEVIARLDSYNKVKVRLIGLRLLEPCEAGDTIHADGAEPGIITSVCISPRFGNIALGYLRTEFAHEGANVHVRSSRAVDGTQGVEATISRLPFAS